MAVRASQIAATPILGPTTSNGRVSQVVVTTIISLNAAPASGVLTIKFGGIKIYPDEGATNAQ